jgi:putative ABC transport system substrate-binding protein
MNRRARVLLRAVLVAAVALAALPRPGAGGPHRIGVVLPGEEFRSVLDGLKEGLARLGHDEGRTIEYLVDDARGDRQRIDAAARRFVAARVDVVYTVTNTALKIVIDATQGSRTPVVFGSASGPVESGIVPAYASRDARVTGVSSGTIELVPKRLEMLKEAVPRVTRVALFGDADAESSRAAFALAAQSAPRLGLSIIEFR